MIVTAACGVCEYLTEDGISVSYEAWKSSWDSAGEPDNAHAVDGGRVSRFQFQHHQPAVTDA
jgi:hypothetical protein